jgi:hypothetical protein
MVQTTESAAPLELAEAVAVVETTTVIAVERPAPDTVVMERETIQSTPSGVLERGATGQASP